MFSRLLIFLTALCVSVPAFAAPAARTVSNRWQIPAGSILVQTGRHRLLFAVDADHVIEYPVAVGRRGARWKGTALIARKASWPAWHPTAKARRRDRRLPRAVAGGRRNPMGARALYLHRGGRDTFYRIHGTNSPSSIGRSVSSGCIRMRNADVIRLASMVRIGAVVRVV